jgi:hypothetical protein
MELLSGTVRPDRYLPPRDDGMYILAGDNASHSLICTHFSGFGKTLPHFFISTRFSFFTTPPLTVWTKKSELHESLHILFPEKKSLWAMRHPIFLFGEEIPFSPTLPLTVWRKNLRFTNLSAFFTKKT